jgi:hypothetical protein
MANKKLDLTLHVAGKDFNTIKGGHFFLLEPVAKQRLHLHADDNRVDSDQANKKLISGCMMRLAKFSIPSEVADNFKLNLLEPVANQRLVLHAADNKLDHGDQSLQASCC